MTIHLEQHYSGQYEKGYEYRYFVLSKLNDERVWQTSEINTVVSVLFQS